MARVCVSVAAFAFVCPFVGTCVRYPMLPLSVYRWRVYAFVLVLELCRGMDPEFDRLAGSVADRRRARSSGPHSDLDHDELERRSEIERQHVIEDATGSDFTYNLHQ